MPPSKKTRKGPTVSPYFNKQAGLAKAGDHESITVKQEEDMKSIEEEDKGVHDLLDYDLKVLFVGINPGLTSTAKGHHYAGPTNHFWPCLSASGLVDRKVTFEDDNQLPARYGLGFTNLTARTTRSASELSSQEQRERIPILNTKIATFRPRIACFIGKGIYEIYSRRKCNLGLQEQTIPWSTGDGETIIFVMPSTSGRVSAYHKSDKIKFFQDLCELSKQQDKIYTQKSSA
ncbi:hypothetical protein INT47_002331 [Mucor saturninus]|uniref:G/T mismatch-specific thymine DNA glycosylase n=1 Tax=Mucor saturninus TaxID=64648 RepID=A0A8H7UUL4_9FUNG|nr:hypothetical protein INT47_002331 [Mucor saturninus]